MFKLQLNLALVCVTATMAFAQGNGLELIQSAVLPGEFFQTIGDNSYIISEHKMNWFDAFSVCRAVGADLATIGSEDELDLLSRRLVASGRTNDRFWIDLNHLSAPFQFFSFNSGRRAGFLKWSFGQPDNRGGVERCVGLRLTRDDAGQFRMNDAVCTVPEFFICKKRE